MATATTLGNPGEAFGGLAYDSATGVLYGGSANLAIPGELIDTVESFPVFPAGAQEVALATGLGAVGGLAVKPDGTVLAVDDPSGDGNAGEGSMLATGVPAALLTGGPGAGGATNDATLTFAVTTSGTAECRLAPVDRGDPGRGRARRDRRPRRAAPRLTLSLRSGRARLHASAIALPLRCSETCVAQAGGTISVRGSARLYRLRGASKVVRRGRSGTLVVRVPRSALGLDPAGAARRPDGQPQAVAASRGRRRERPDQHPEHAGDGLLTSV